MTGTNTIFCNRKGKAKLNILLVEDNKLDRDHILALIREWESFNEKIGLNVLDRIDDQNIQSYQGYDAALLDISIPGIDGMTFANELRKYNSRIEIAFITQFTDYTFKGFQVHACGYITKPIEKKDFFSLLDFMLTRSRLHMSDEETICISRGVMQQDFYYPDDILYIEAGLHGIFVRTLNGKTKYAYSLSAIKNKLPYKTFVRCHRGYIVNITKIIAIEKDCAVLVNNESVCIGNTYFNDVKRAVIGLMK